MAEDARLLAHDIEVAKLRRHGGKEGLTGCISRKALFNAVRTEGIEVLTPAGKGYWDDMRRRGYPQLNLNNNGRVPGTDSLNGMRNRWGRVSERFYRGKWWHVEKGEWVEGENKREKVNAKP